MYAAESGRGEAVPLLVDVSQSLLLFIDLQSKLAPAIDQAEACLSRCQLLLAAARRLDVPIFATEHCPASVGNTVPILGDKLAPSEILEKRHFNAVLEPAVNQALARQPRRMIVVAGMEAHVCVLQTVLGLKQAGYSPVLVADAVGSRAPCSRDLAIERMRHRGIDIVNAEMVLFEWLEVGGTEAFRDLLPMIKSGSVD
jgi:nicotinamidase-related amidase